jgi:hypothetical protein
MKRAPLLVALGLAALVGCGPDQGASPTAGNQVTRAAAKADVPTEPPAPQSTPEPRAGNPRLDARAGGGTNTRGDKASTDPFNVIDVEITAPTPFKLKLRVQPELAPDLASAMARDVNGAQGATSFTVNEQDGERIGAVLKLDRTTFTVAGRPIDVVGKRLQVCGIGFGPLATGDVVTLARGEVRVENVFRGPLPAPVAPR